VSGALTVLITFLLGFSAVLFGSEILGRTPLHLGAFYGHSVVERR
jgi:hypothetical protein